jgi:tetratricopeptide (TPR) repeat protein
VELFRQRARAAAANGDVDYELAAEICERVDRLPLAIELAAARVKVLEPAALLERLDERLPLLSSRSRDLPERQRTLHSTVAWSYELLTPEEQVIFRRLAVFAGGATLEAVEAVCDADLDLLESLVDKSLLRRWGERFVMLETIREFAAEQLDASGEGDAVRLRQAEFFLELAKTLGMSVETIMRGVEQRHDLARAEAGNLRAALAWAFETGRLELAASVAVGLENFCVTQDPNEGLRWFSALLEREDELRPELLAAALRCYGSSAHASGELDRGLEVFEQSLAVYRQLGDEFGIAVLLHRIALGALRKGDRTRARALSEESLELHRRLDSLSGEGQALSLLAELEWEEGNRDYAFELLERSIALCRQGGFRWWEANLLGAVAEWALQLDRTAEAAGAVRRELELRLAMGDVPGMVFSLGGFALVATRKGHSELAGRVWGAIEAEEARRRIGLWELYRDQFGDPVLAAANPEFEVARREGSRVTLEEAVQLALEASDG